MEKQLIPPPELVAQWWRDGIRPNTKTISYLATKAAEWGASQQRGVVVLPIEIAESVKMLAKVGSGHCVFTADRAGIVAAHLNELQAAIAAAKEKGE